jgi:hypothetical protein
MNGPIQDFSYQLRTEARHVELTIANPSAMFEREQELTFRVEREQVRELAAAFVEMDKAFDLQEADDRARQAGMTFAQRFALRMELNKERRQADRNRSLLG